jgi:N-acetylmuramic acid 6-phosphate etherase
VSGTEGRNPATIDIDIVPARQAIDAILAEDAFAVAAAQRASAELAAAVDETAARLRSGGRLHYFGAGASGRLAVLDATELTPTYGAARGLVTAHFPGGATALVDSSIDLEDARTLGAEDAAALTGTDVAFGITASGSTPYVAGALAGAAGRGAFTILLTCSPGTRIPAELTIVADTGPEAITGSTRLKAGTATKVLLNAFSSALMIGLGRTYSNLMTGMSVTNDKLRRRAVGLLSEAAGVPADTARAAYAAAGDDTEVALVALLTGVDPESARELLAAGGSVRAASSGAR